MLRELEPGAGGKGDVVIGGGQDDQGNHEAGEHLDIALEIQPATTDAETAEEATAEEKGGGEKGGGERDGGDGGRDGERTV